jgi:hypothetical protein
VNCTGIEATSFHCESRVSVITRSATVERAAACANNSAALHKTAPLKTMDIDAAFYKRPEAEEGSLFHRRSGGQENRTVSLDLMIFC